MIEQREIDELMQIQSSANLVLSLYLETDTGKEPGEAIKLRVKSMINDAGLKNDPNAVAIEQFLDRSFTWDAKGVAIFAWDEGAFFRVFPTAVAFRNRLRIGDRPYLKPLVHLMDYYAHYGVILIDRVGARFFSFHLGELQAMEGFMGEEVQKLKEGRGSAAVGMRGGVGEAMYQQLLRRLTPGDASGE